MKKKKARLCYVLVFLFIIFSCVYIISESGYYEYTLQGKTVLTREKILEFEKDINNGENIDLKRYFQEDKKYSNKFTRGTNKLSNDFVKVSRKIMKRIFRFLNNYFSE